MSSKANVLKGPVSSSMSASQSHNPNQSSVADSSSSSPQKSSALSQGQEQASSSFQNFLKEEGNALDEYVRRRNEARQKIIRHSKAYANIENTMDHVSHLQLTVSGKDSELREKNAEIEGLNLIRQTTLKDYQNEYDNWKHQHNDMQATIKALNSSSKEANARAEAADGIHVRLRETLAQIEAVERKAAKAEQRFRKADDRSRELDRQLDQCTARLREWDEYISVLEDIDFSSL